MTPRTQCPACRSTRFATAADLAYDQPPLSDYLRSFYAAHPRCDFGPLAGTRYQLADCADCGCIFQIFIPHERFLSGFYAEGLYGVGKPAPAPTDPYQTEHHVRELMMVFRFLSAAIPRPRVLDFGTGQGAWALLAAAAGADTHATDLSGHAFPHLSARGVTCHHADSLAAADFDLINTEQVFEHLADPTGLLHRLGRSLRPGGILKIGVPHDPSLRQKLRQPRWTAPKDSPDSLNAVAPIEHLNHFEPASLQVMAAGAGLEPLTVDGWDLLPASGPLLPTGLRQRTGRWLRRQLREVYQPHHRLTQTAFFRRPAAA